MQIVDGFVYRLSAFFLNWIEMSHYQMKINLSAFYFYKFCYSEKIYFLR